MKLSCDTHGRYFNENDTARCSFGITDSGLVFADADHTYMCLIGKTIEDLGRTSAEIFGGTGHAEKLLALCKVLGGSASLPKKYPCGLMRRDTAYLRGSELVIESAPCSADADFGISGSEKYIGSITVTEKNSVFAAEYFTAGISVLFGTLRAIPDAVKLLSRNIGDLGADAVFRTVIASGRAADVCAVCGSVPGKGRRAVHISAVPLGDARLMISFFLPVISGATDVTRVMTASGRVTDIGGISVLCGMTAYLGAMLELREITLPFILSAAEKVRESGERMSFPFGGKDGVTMFAAPCTADPGITEFTVCENDEAAVGYGIRLTQLTKREYTVMYHAAKGKSNPEIAGLLGIAEGTVSKLLYHGYKKLNIASRTDAARLF